MGIVIGIDVGGSTTKIVGVEDKKIKNPMFVKATDPVTSLFGAFGKYIYDNNISLSNIEKVILTGVGSAYIDQPLYGLPTAKTDEFLANGLGAQYNTGLDSLLVVSMGTGTSFVKVQGSTVEHIGGLGIGGGTILGLSKLLLKTHDFHQIASLAEHGSLNDIDLHIRDITPHPLPGLPLDVTASIFGKADANAKVEDIALGIVHMVLQTIGQGAVFASLNGDIKNIVLIGNLTRLPQCPDIRRNLQFAFTIEPGGEDHIAAAFADDLEKPPVLFRLSDRPHHDIVLFEFPAHHPEPFRFGRREKRHLIQLEIERPACVRLRRSGGKSVQIIVHQIARRFLRQLRADRDPQRIDVLEHQHIVTFVDERLRLFPGVVGDHRDHRFRLLRQIADMVDQHLKLGIVFAAVVRSELADRADARHSQPRLEIVPGTDPQVQRLFPQHRSRRPQKRQDQAAQRRQRRPQRTAKLFIKFTQIHGLPHCQKISRLKNGKRFRGNSENFQNEISAFSASDCSPS